jgi:hypothetical protein
MTDATRPATSSTSVKIVGIIIAVLGVLFLVAGIVTYAIVSDTLASENIVVADDAERFAGEDVEGPFTAYYQADVIAEHAEEIAGGKTYAELDREDPNRATVMDASFLRASLFTSVVAFGVAAFVAVMGVVLMLLGWALIRLGRAPQPVA